jgi:ABC-type sugar transport system permease subunit
VLTTAILGYLLAVAVALSGTLGARMQEDGTIAEAYQQRPLSVLAVTIPYGLSGIAALLYFSWAYLNIYQIVTFLLVLLGLTYWDTSGKPGKTVWNLFMASVALTVATEVALVAAAGI